MKERPILFSGPMVRAILDGTKTQTRRIVHPDIIVPKDEPEYILYRCPYGGPGDRLWVREAWKPDVWFHPDKEKRTTVPCIKFRAGGHQLHMGEKSKPQLAGPFHNWRPSIHMPRWASRIDLEVVNVRVERLQEISEADAKAEGIEREHSWDGQPGFGYDMGMWYKLYGGHSMTSDPVESFRTLWDSINAARGHGWDQNDWVWVVEFARI